MAEAADSHDQMTHDSDHLFRLCCNADLSEPHWRRHLQENDAINTATSYILGTHSVIRYKAIFSGSHSEGVAMLFLGSDLDEMWVVSGTHVIEDDYISTNESDNVFKMIATNHPAFVNTELRHRGETADSKVRDTPKYCQNDGTGRLLLNGELLKNRLTNDVMIQHGPAVTMRVGEVPIDFVLSLHCRSWPSVSREWIDRPREYNWPTPEQINEIVDNGCELVSIGAPNSASPQFDWRLSSSLAEKILVRSFNIYQMHCYLLLKVILKHRIKPCFSIETLCSYHMKTIMLYVVETTNPVVWRRNNLVYCFMMCLQKLQSFLKDGNCPQYFIPQHNLFERKVKPQLEKVMEIVNDIVAEGWRCVLVCPPFNNFKVEETHRISIPAFHMPSFPLMPYTVININCAGSLQGFIGELQHMRFHEVENESNYFPCKATVLVIRSLCKSTIGLSLLNRVTGRQDRDHVERLVLQYAKQCMESACENPIGSCTLKYALFLYVNKETQRCVDFVNKYIDRENVKQSLPICSDTVRHAGPSSIPQYSYICRKILLDVDDAGDTYERFIPEVQLSKWEVKVCPLIIKKVAETRQLVTKYDREHPSVLMIDFLVFTFLLLVLAYHDLGRCAESRQYLELLRQCAETSDHFYIFYPDIARLLLEQCQQYVSSGSQQDVSPSNLLTEGCLFTPRKNLFLQLWKLTAIYNQALLKMA